MTVTLHKYQIKDIAQVIGGGTPDTSNNEYWDGDIAWVSPKDLSGYQHVYISRGNKNITKQGLKNSSTKLLPAGTVLLSSRAPIGYVAIAENPICTNQGFKSFICDESKLNNLYFYYWLKNNKDLLFSLGKGTTFPEISKTILETLEIQIPDLSTQKRIAEILSGYDDLIENNLKQISLLEESAAHLYKHFFSSPKKDWQIKKIGEVYSIKYGKNLPTTKIKTNGKYPVYGANGVIGYYDKTNTDNFSVLITSRGNGSGEVSRTLYKETFVTNNSFIVSSLYDYISYPYIYFNMKDINFIALRTGSAQPQLTNASIDPVSVILPPEQLIKKYCSIALPLFKKVELLNKSIELYRESRDLLLPKLMSGELQV